MNINNNELDVNPTSEKSGWIASMKKYFWDKINSILEWTPIAESLKTHYNQILLLILSWMLVVNSNAHASDNNVKFKISNSNNWTLTWLEVCNSTSPDFSDPNAITCIESSIITPVPDYCIEDPNPNLLSYQAFMLWMPDLPDLFYAARTINDWNIKSPFWNYFENSNDDPYNRVSFDIDGDGKPDILEYRNWYLYKHLSTDLLSEWCISTWTWDWSDIVQWYSTWDKKLIESYEDWDEIPDLVLFDPVQNTCEIDNSSNWFNWIDEVVNNCSLINTDTLFYNPITWKAYAWFMNDTWTWYSFLGLSLKVWQQIVPLKNWINPDKIFWYQKSSWQARLSSIDVTDTITNQWQA